MKPNHLKNLSANTIQLVINQVFGLAIFYVLSTRLDKASFGQLNWVLAVLLTAFNILSCGVDQLVVKKIAHGDDAGTITGLYVNHVLLSGITFYVVLALLWLLFPQQALIYQLLLIVGAGKLMFYFSIPFKQLAIGKEQFGLLAKMSVASNLTKGLGLIILALLHKLTLISAVIIFLSGDILEFIVTLYFYYVHLHVPFSWAWKPKPYFALLKEALPQIGVVLFTSALARFDWIFIGLFLSSVKLAEYSFAYKAFEISTLPLLAIAPLLLPRFVKVIKDQQVFPPALFGLLKLELVVSTLIGLVLYLCWSPLVDGLTGGKYGAVNATVVLVLALCMPLMYFNNFLWSIGFAQGKMKIIFRVFAITFLVNLVGDVVLIPLLGNIGAALAYLGAMFVQAILYILYIEKPVSYRPAIDLVFCLLYGLASGFIAMKLFNNILLITISSGLIYLFLAVLSGYISLKKLKALKLIVS